MEKFTKPELLDFLCEIGEGYDPISGNSREDDNPEEL